MKTSFAIIKVDAGCNLENKIMKNEEIRTLVLNNLDIILQRLNEFQTRMANNPELGSKEDIAYSDGIGYAKLIILDYMKEKFYGEN